ncbi:hypothetical protein M514_01186 [Trichuris suis]|uniref:F-box domain-containing protein n=1 Tax=Trichuris suis TaxID=68888 RepID=A0A085ML57_9BILA|nr:hypothetical protein M513_01186 [Trichuris suis]KFD70865.1 hypothetical protein M514_01186 [Trichuris suis]KHJ45818.1 F-box domain protein [Trichuris suis]
MSHQETDGIDSTYSCLPTSWDLFDTRYEAWKERRRAERQRQRRLLVIEEPRRPYIQSMPLEVLRNIIKHIDKSALLSARSVNSTFRREITIRMKTLTRVDLAQFLPEMFAIEGEQPVALILSSVPNVQELVIPGTVLRVLRNPVVELIAGLKDLKKLDMNNCFITFKGLRKLSESLPNLEELSLRSTRFVDREIDFENRRESRAVAYLSLSATSTEEYTSFFLSYKEIGDHVIGKLLLWKNLKKLDISGCVVEDSILKRMLCELTHLEELLVDDPRTIERLEREYGIQAREQPQLTALQNRSHNGLSVLDRPLDNLRTLSLMNWHASDSSVKNIMEKCTSLRELRFKLGYRPRNGIEPYFGSTKLITDHLPHPELLNTLSLYNIRADSNWPLFFSRCHRLKELTIEPMPSEADHLGDHVIFGRKAAWNSLKVPPRLFKMLTKWKRNMSPSLASFVICEIQPLTDPYEVDLSVSDTFTMPLLPDYTAHLEAMLSSLYRLDSLRVLSLIWKCIDVSLLYAIPDSVLRSIEVLDLQFGFDTPLHKITTLIERVCGRFCRRD